MLQQTFQLKKRLSSVLILTMITLGVPVQAGVVYDNHGNRGYDTEAECMSAIANATDNSLFYKSFTHKPPLLRAGETSVKVGRLGDVTKVAKGVCDKGVGHRAGRDGVSQKLQGKYVPYSSEMEVNQYFDRNGKLVRMTMRQCDNWFSDNILTAINPSSAVAPKPMVAEVPAKAVGALGLPAPVVPAVATAPAAPVAGGAASGVGAATSAGVSQAAVAIVGIAAVAAGIAATMSNSNSTTTQH